MPFNIPTPASPLGQPAAFKPPAPPKPGRATGEAFTANKSFYNKGYGAAKTAFSVAPIARGVSSVGRALGSAAGAGARAVGKGAWGATKIVAPFAIPAGIGAYQAVQPQKVGSIIHPAVDITGLGLLAARPLHHLLHSRNPESVRDAKWELAGLGTLAVPSIYDIGKLLYHNLSLSR
jgi:hypothetical protein